MSVEATYPLEPAGAPGSAAAGVGGSDGDLRGEGDVRLVHTPDGGEIDIVNGRVRMDLTPATAAYLSLFGGNERDGRTDATEHLQWWGNLLEEEPARHLRSETQHLLRSLPAITANLRRVEDAAGRDLGWMSDELGADVSVRASIPALNRIQLDIEIEIDGTTHRLRFTEDWE